jgi:hypothetical protein
MSPPSLHRRRRLRARISVSSTSTTTLDVVVVDDGTPPRRHSIDHHHLHPLLHHHYRHHNRQHQNLDDKYCDFLMTSSSWSPDDLNLFEPRATTFDTPPVTQCSNKAQIYERHGYEAMSSSGGSSGGGGLYCWWEGGEDVHIGVGREGRRRGW